MADALVAVAIVVSGVALIALHGRRDLAGFAEEAIPFRQALTLWGWGDAGPTANPHFFSYPSLSIYFHWAVQWIATSLGITTGRYEGYADAGVEFALAPGNLVLAGRLATTMCLGAGAWLAYAWWRDRSRATGLLASAGVLFAPSLVRSAVQMPPEALMGPLAVLVLHWLRRPAASPGRQHVLCGVGAGALCGLKYSAVPFLLVAIAALGLGQPGRRPARSRAATALLVAAVTFVASTPFSVLAWPEFASGVAFELEHLAAGHLGGSRLSTALTHLRQLHEALGPALALSLAVLLLHQPARSRGAILLLAGAAAFVVPALLSSSGAPERYLVPAIPLLVLFTWEVAHAASRSSALPARLAGWALVAACVFRLLAGLSASARPSEASPVARASDWVRATAAPEDIVVQDHGGIAVYSTADQQALGRSRCLAQASEAWRARAAAQVARTVVTIPFAASGRIFAEVETGAGRRDVVLFDPAWTLAPRLYSVLEDVRVQYFVRHAGIARRLGEAVAADDRHPGPFVPQGPVAFAARVRAGALMDDVEIVVHRGANAPDTSGALSAGWWLQDAVPPPPTGSGAADSAAYALATRKIFDQRVRPFLLALAEGALRRRDAEALVAATRLLLVSNPDDLVAIRMALIGLGASEPQAVWGAGGRTRLTRAVAEPRPAWLARALGAWGVHPETAAGEVSRYLALRGR